MTMETEVLSGNRGYRLRSEAEQNRAFERAARHSRLVGILRKVLPALAVAVFAAYFISSRLSMTMGGVTASIDGVQVNNGNLRMVNPKLKGADQKHGSYIIGADYADQDVKTPKIIQLHAIKAELNNPSGGWSRVEAVRGTFDSDAERLVMREAITLVTSTGVTGKLTRATLDTKNQTLRTHSPVTFDMVNGTVRANAMTRHSSDHTLLFRGNVRVHINKTAKPAPAEGPAASSAPLVQAPTSPAGAPPSAAAALGEGEMPR
jgi:lipopolysaccharide export system protein LptC